MKQKREGWWSAPSTLLKINPRKFLSAGLGCLIPMGLFVIIFFPANMGIRLGFPLFFLGLFLAIGGLSEHIAQKRSSLVCPNCNKRNPYAKKQINPVCKYCLEDLLKSHEKKFPKMNF